MTKKYIYHKTALNVGKWGTCEDRIKERNYL